MSVSSGKWTETRPEFPLLYQINTRILISEAKSTLLSLGNQKNGSKKYTLRDFLEVDEFINAFVYKKKRETPKYNFIYLLGVWQTGEASREISRTNVKELENYKKELPDFKTDDISGSPFAVQSYTFNRDFGEPEHLKMFSEKLHSRGIGLILDFVPNHTALDHPWVKSHPEYYIQGTEQSLAREPQNYIKIDGKIFAHGKDPYFDGWRDTLQLNYRHPRLQQAMVDELFKIAAQCDGVRCDMAMLVLPEIFKSTWSNLSLPQDNTPACEQNFWEYAIKEVRKKYPSFVFMAEVYWDKEWELQQLGFDYTYDKKLYDLLLKKEGWNIYGHLRASPDYQQKSVRFLENHDEERIAHELPNFEQHQAAAIVAFLVPGLRFFHQGQAEGRKIHISMHLQRRQNEKKNSDVDLFYSLLLGDVLFRDPVRNGNWHLLNTSQAWEGNISKGNFIPFMWIPNPAKASPKVSSGQRSLSKRGRSSSIGEDVHTEPLFVIVNYSEYQSQCYVWLEPLKEILHHRTIILSDIMHSEVVYERNGTDVLNRGLYFDMKPWGYHVFGLQIN